MCDHVTHRFDRFEPQTLKVKLLSENGKLPQRATEGSAGYDLYAAEDFTLFPDSDSYLVKTDISISLPLNSMGRILSRSSMALKGIHAVAGTIDEDFLGEVKVMLINLSTNEYQIKRGDRIAQLVIIPVLTPSVQQVDELDDTARGMGGFGSTGI